MSADQLLNKLELDLVLGALDSLGVALADHNHQWTAGEKAIYESAIELVTKVRDFPHLLPCSTCGEDAILVDFFDTSTGARCYIARVRRKTKCYGRCDGHCKFISLESSSAAILSWNEAQIHEER